MIRKSKELKIANVILQTDINMFFLLKDELLIKNVFFACLPSINFKPLLSVVIIELNPFLSKYSAKLTAGKI